MTASGQQQTRSTQTAEPWKVAQPQLRETLSNNNPYTNWKSPEMAGGLPPPSAGFGSPNIRPGMGGLPPPAAGFGSPNIRPGMDGSLPPPSAGFGSPNVRPDGLPPPAAGFGNPDIRPGGDLPPPSAGFGNPDVRPSGGLGGVHLPIPLPGGPGVGDSVMSATSGATVAPNFQSLLLPAAGFGSPDIRPGMSDALPPPSAGFGQPNVQPGMGGALPLPSAGFGSPDIWPGTGGLPPPAAGFGQPNIQPGVTNSNLPGAGNHQPINDARRAMLRRLIGPMLTGR